MAQPRRPHSLKLKIALTLQVLLGVGLFETVSRIQWGMLQYHGGHYVRDYLIDLLIFSIPPALILLAAAAFAGSRAALKTSVILQSLIGVSLFFLTIRAVVHGINPHREFIVAAYGATALLALAFAGIYLHELFFRKAPTPTPQ